MAELILEYLKVILTAPVMFAVIAGVLVYVFKDDFKALLARIARIKFPGGAEFSTTQSSSDEEEKRPPPDPPEAAIPDIPRDLAPEQQKTVERLIRSHIANAYLWEYRYLNYFLVPKTQRVLDWLAGLQFPTTLNFYDSFWLPMIPSAQERQTIIGVLEAHHLIFLDRQTGSLEISPKGREYCEWRGPLPSSAYPPQMGKGE